MGRGKGRGSRGRVPVGELAGAGGAASELVALAGASLDELKSRYPASWEQTGRGLMVAIESRHAAGAAAFLAKARAEAAPWRLRVGQSGGNARVVQAALPALVRERMAQLAAKEVVAGANAALATGSKGALVSPGQADRPLRFGLWSGTLVQRLFFRRGLERKPVAMGWFRAVWPLVTQKAALMPLCEPRGIYCFYSQPLVAGLAALIAEAGPEPALEIAAGDGTLSRFLRTAGAEIHATDDHSWSHSIAFPSDVEPLNAQDALDRHAPRAVICSWPPPDNDFEMRVFRTPSVQRYIVVTTRHRFAAGNWAAYDEAQTGFDRRVDDRLSTLVLPPEIDPVVLIFDRRAGQLTPPR